MIVPEIIGWTVAAGALLFCVAAGVSLVGLLVCEMLTCGDAPEEHAPEAEAAPKPVPYTARHRGRTVRVMAYGRTDAVNVARGALRVPPCECRNIRVTPEVPDAEAAK